MKQLIALTFTVLLFHSCLFVLAGRVTQEDAATAARNFFYERISQYGPMTHGDLSLKLAEEVRYQGEVVYYVFNVEPEGFIIVSARDEAYPFLAYSFKGIYDPEQQPVNFSAWMGQYSRQIHHAMTGALVPAPHAAETWHYYLNTPPQELSAFSGREVEPLLTSTWNQGKFYNEMCPEDPAGPGGHCYAGCVATAMGQVMNYFRWPDTGTGSYSYECPPYGMLSANFDSTTYRWDLMETSLLHSNLYLAELLYHLGVSVDMVYGPDGSGMYNHKAAYSLKTYFKYSPETQYVYRDSTSMDWDSLLVSHLDRGIPMYYAGWSVPNIYGHAFVCDGYQDSAYYHFNWGWGGSFDGYFYTDNLTPGGSNFNLAQELIINAVPDTVTYNYPAYCEGSREFTELFGTIEDGSGPLYASQPLSDCQWLIAPADSVDGLSLEFLRFSLGQSDTLSVFDGDTVAAPLLAAFTQGDAPGTVETSGNTLLVTYRTDETPSEGFLAEFSSDLPVYCSGNAQLSGQTDTLTDGSGPWDYQNNTQCMWMISPAGATELTLHFLDFETEEDHDFLRIYDLATQELLAEYSGDYAPGLPDPVTSPSGSMFIVFMTNYSQRAQGWTAYYMTDLVGTHENAQNAEGINVYPNPSSGTFTVDLGDNAGLYRHLLIQDIFGRTLLSEDLEENAGERLVQLRDLPEGMYILVLSGDNAKRVTHRVIIR